jgi:hypothetical protein
VDPLYADGIKLGSSLKRTIERKEKKKKEKERKKKKKKRKEKK